MSQRDATNSYIATMRMLEHQHTTDFPKYPIYDVWEWPLSRLPPRLAGTVAVGLRSLS